MKKILVLFSLVVFLFGVISAQTITVTKPSQGDAWNKGTKYNITWTTTGNVYQFVKIRLFNSSATVKELDIGASIPTADGIAEWTIPGTVNPGSYVVIVRASNNSTTGISEVFTIAGVAEQEPSISVKEPQLNKDWYMGETSVIKWDKSGALTPNVKITLHEQPETQPVMIITSGASNSGTYPWPIPSSLSTGSYVVRVATTDNAVSDYSKQFNIKQKLKLNPGLVPIHGKIEILKPSSSSNWKEGTSHQIKWKNTFTKDKGFTIDLYNYSGSKFIKKIRTFLPSPVKKIYKGRGRPSETSTYSWFIPKGTYKWPGNYRIKIKRSDGNASGVSEMFHVKIGTKVKIHEINGSIGNYCKRTFWASGTGSAIKVAKMKEQLGGCIGVGGSAKGWAGYANYLVAYGGSYYGDIWRTHVTFNLSQFIGKGYILKAKLKYNKKDFPAGSSCAVSVYRLLSSMGDAFSINGDLIGNTSDMTSIAQNWMGFPNGNFGIMFVGPNESFQHNNSKCQAYLMSIKLEIEFLEKE